MLSKKLGLSLTLISSIVFLLVVKESQVEGLTFLYRCLLSFVGIGSLLTMAFGIVSIDDSTANK